MLRRLRSRLSALWTWKRREADLDEELRFHLEAEAEERQDAGAGAADARRAARLDFGNPSVVAEDARATWGWGRLEQFAQDVRYAVRTLSKSRAFTAAAVLSLALGIGANTLLYSFTDAILIRALPVVDPESLVRMTWHAPKSEFHGSSYHDSSFKDPAAGYTDGIFAYAAFELCHAHDDILSSVFAYQETGPITLTVHEQAAPATGEYVSGEYFSGLGMAPAAGRWLGPDDDREGAPPVVVLSRAVADGRFGGASQAVGQTLLINNSQFAIVGVASREFSGTDPGAFPDVYVPLHASFVLQRRAVALVAFSDPNEVWLEVMGRLRPGVSFDPAQAALAPPYHLLTERVKTLGTWSQAPELVIVAGAQGIDGVRRAYATPLVLLTGLSGLILLLACANIANLLLARSAARAREIAVRVSLGASRGRVIRQLLTESVVLASVGGLLGVGLAVLGAPVITRLLSDGQANFTLHAELNWRVLCFAGALSMVTGLLSGAIPAMRATRTALLPAIKETDAGRRFPRLMAGNRRRASVSSRALVVVQIGATLVMLVAAGLFVRTLARFAALDLGFRPDHLLTVAVNAKQGGLDDAAATALYRDLRARFAAMPGALSVGMSDSALVGDERMMTSVVPVGHASQGATFMLNIGAGFFHTLDMPIVQGRDLDEADERPGATPVVVVSESYARMYFGDANAVGQIVRVPVRRGSLEIVGVARDARYYSLLRERPPVAYVPFTLAIFGDLNKMVYEIRTSADPSTYERAARQIVHGASARVPIVSVATQASLIDRLIAPQILLSRLCATFAILALVIAVVGLYGTVAYDVARRTREIGIRMALGADDRQVVRLVLGDVLVLAIAGVALGVPAALVASKFANVYLFGITNRDPVTIVAAVSVLLAAALIASYAPARAASRLNPTIALRRE